MTSNAVSNDDDWEDNDDTTVATTDSTKAKAGHRNQASASKKDEDDDGDEEGDRTGKKKRKKRANKRTVAKLKEMRKDFIDRCVSPNYHRVSRLQLNGEVFLTNLKGLEADGRIKGGKSKKVIRNGAAFEKKETSKAEESMKYDMANAGYGGAIHPGMMDGNFGMDGFGMGGGFETGGFETGYPDITNVNNDQYAKDWQEKGIHPGMLPYNEAPKEEALYGKDHDLSDDTDGSEDEEIHDYHIDGYHPVHLK